MEIIELKNLTDVEKESFNSIPDEYINRLKKLTIEQQLKCIYIKKTDYNRISVLEERDPAYIDKFRKCLNLSRWNIEKIYVYDGVIVAVLDQKHRLIKFGTAYSEKVTETYTYMDSHDHRLYERTESTKYMYYLIIYQNHEYLTDGTK